MPTSDSPELRPYRADDLPALLAFVGECYLRADGCGNLHPGDIVHTMSNGLRGRDLDQHFFLSERDGRLRALLVIDSAREAAFDVIIAPDERGGDRERGLLVEGERRTRALLRRETPDESERAITTGAMDCDAPRRDLLGELGYTPDPEPLLVMTKRPLDDDLPAPILPDGFFIRSVTGENEVAAVAAVHDASFTPKWTPSDAYLAVMRTPGFAIDREVVVVAPDGTFAAFIVYWLDPISRTGEFEPVGTSRDYQRRGLGTALMYEGMRRMRAAGMRAAAVTYLPTNPPANALYTSVGFRQRGAYTIYHPHGTSTDAR